MVDLQQHIWLIFGYTQMPARYWLIYKKQNYSRTLHEKPLTASARTKTRIKSAAAEIYLAALLAAEARPIKLLALIFSPHIEPSAPRHPAIARARRPMRREDCLLFLTSPVLSRPIPAWAQTLLRTPLSKAYVLTYSTCVSSNRRGIYPARHAHKDYLAFVAQSVPLAACDRPSARAASCPLAQNTPSHLAATKTAHINLAL